MRILKFIAGIILIFAAFLEYARVLSSITSWKEYPLGSEFGLIIFLLLGAWLIKSAINKKGVKVKS